MAITIRNQDTIKLCETLLNNSSVRERLSSKTKAGVVDYTVGRHLDLVNNLKTANDEIRKLRNELFEIKAVVRKNTQAVKSFADMCDKINGEK